MKSFLIFCIISLVGYHAVLCSIGPSIKDKNFDELSETIVKIIKDVCIPTTSQVDVISSRATPTDLIAKFAEETCKLEAMSATLVETLSSLESKAPRICNLFFVESFESFNKIYNKISPTLFDFHGFYTIVLTEGNINGTDEIFKLLWAKQIYNAAILYVDKFGLLKGLTFNPFNSLSCTDVQSTGVPNLEDLFKEKLKDLKQCPIRVQGPNWRPYVYTTDGEIHGRDFDLVTVISEALNFKLDLEVLPDIASWGMLFENGTATGAIKNLFESKIDFIVGDYYLRPIRLKFMDASVEYFTNDVVFVIPPGRTLLSIEKLFQPFSKTVWIILTSSFLIMFGLLFAIGILKRKPFDFDTSLVCFKMLSIFFAVSLPRSPKTSAIRWLFLSFVMFCLVKQAVYQGLLFKFLQSDSKLKEVQSIDDMIDKGFMFYSYDSMLEVIQSEKTIIDRWVK